MDALISKLAAEGGCIVSTAACSAMETADAQVRGDFYTDAATGLGYVRRLPEWLARHCEYARAV